MTLRWRKVDDDAWQALLPGGRCLLVVGGMDDAPPGCWTFVAGTGDYWSWTAQAVGDRHTAQEAFAEAVDAARALGWLPEVGVASDSAVG